jgi:UDP-glucose 4-epimerase
MKHMLVNVTALDWLTAGKPSGAFNLGNGRGFSIREVIQTSEAITGLPIRSEMCPPRPGDPPILVSDSSRARNLLGWTPRFSALDQQIRHTWKWFCDELPRLSSRSLELTGSGDALV